MTKADVNSREEALAWASGGSVLRRARRSLGANMLAIVDAAHALMWDGDDATGVTSREAVARAVGSVFPSALAAKAEAPGSCPRCMGLGYISAFAHVLGGDCFGCKGTGILPPKG